MAYGKTDREENESNRRMKNTPSARQNTNNRKRYGLRLRHVNVE